MKIKGTVTRLVPADDRTSKPARVFFRCDDPADLAKIDGSKRAATDEVIVVAALEGYTVGTSAEFEL